MNKFFFLLGVFVSMTVSIRAEQNTFELKDGERVVFIGGTFIEREQEENYLETMLTRAFPERNVTFRNLGWSGDTVHTFVNSPVEPRPKYVPTLLDYVTQLKPTVLFVSYGMMESFEGEAGLGRFVQDYNTLLDRLSGTTKQIVIISPFAHEKLAGVWPEPASHNRNLKLYVEAMKKMADARGLRFINLFEKLPMNGKRALTGNGVHLNTAGYRAATTVIAKELGLKVAEKDFTRDDALRAAIKDKNAQWWYHYRPMNSEYVYEGGERYQVKIGPVELPMYTEIQEFAKLAQAGDVTIAKLRQDKSAAKSRAKTQPQSRPSRIDTTSPSPEEELQSFQVAEGFEVNLFAADPLIDKPVQMAFDAKGRLWVASTTLYPQIRPGERATDKVIILEDSNGDGRADKTSLFADDLYIPTGLLPSSDGCYISDDTKIYFYRDQDRDGHADSKEVVLSGFGTEDSHHKAHVFRWGPEGNIYFNVGVFLHNNIETPHGVVNVTGRWQPGIFSFRPDTGKVDMHLANNSPANPWGHYWNRWGFDFIIDSSGQGGSYLILPTANRTSSSVQVTGGGGKLAGAEIIHSRHFPDDWQGNLVASPFKENRVSRWKFSDDSSGYALSPQAPVIVSTNNSFRPVESRIGPDGALYILDWYNPLIGHMQYHFRDPGRDKTHGRIWRVTAKNRPLLDRPKLDSASTKELLEALKAPEDITRNEARRLLAEKSPKEVVPALNTWVKNLDASAPDFDHYRTEALWTLQNLNVVHVELLQDLLKAKDPNARAAAATAVRHWADRMEDPLAMLANSVVDENPRVRLAAVITLSHLKQPRAMELAARTLDFTMDRYLDEALKNTVSALKGIWLPAFQSGAITFGNNPKHLEFVLKSIGSQEAVKPFLKLVREKRISGRYLEGAIDLITTHGGADDLTALVRANLPPEWHGKLAAALVKAARERKVIPQGDDALLQKWFESSDENLKSDALRLAGAWKRDKFNDTFLQIASSETSLKVRSAAVEGLAALEGESTEHALQQLVSGEAPLEVRYAALNGLAGKNLKRAAEAAATVLAQDFAGKDPAPVFQTFLQQKEGAKTLGAALNERKINADNAKLGLRVVQTSGQQDPILVKALSEAAGLTSETKQLSREELLQWVSEVQSEGNPVRGEQIFHRDELNCFKCHGIAGAGGQVGPDLSAVGGGSTVDYLIESILYPNKIIKDGFETLEVTMKDDEYYLGIRVRENPEQIVLKDAAHTELVIPKDRIRDRANKPVSIMPSGLAATLTHRELIDLVRFLSELGRPGAYANDPKPLVRRWRVPDAASKTNWIPAYSFVNGDLSPQKGSQKIAAARCDLEVTTPGKIGVKVNSTTGLKLLVDQKSIEIKENLLLDLGRGVHGFHFEIDPARTQPLHVEFEEVAGSPGRFQVVGGP